MARRPWHTPVRSAFTVLVAVFATVLPAGAAALGAAATASAATEQPGGSGAWAPPVDGPVVERFDPPAVRWGPGHLGIDYAVPPGTAVCAAGDGVVVFAGQVAGSLHVVVLHTGGLRTSYSFLASIAVHRGATVVRGALVGRTGGTGGGHGAGVLHLGLRVGERYVDPLLLFRPVDLVSAVHLAPTGDVTGILATPGAERGGLVAGLGRLARHVRGAGRAVVAAVADLVGGTGAAADRAVEGMLSTLDAFGRTLEPIAEALAAGAAQMPGVAARLLSIPPLRLLPDLMIDVGASLLAWANSRDDCDPDSPPADGKGGSGHDVMVVAGINSETDESGATVDLPVSRLGYSQQEVTYFSYAHGGGGYAPDDSYIPIEAAAARLADQLRSLHAAHPGREVDLIAHSQGGVVALAFLELVYDPADPSYPPLGPVVTLSSPLDGAPLATLGVVVARSRAGRAFLDNLPGNLVPPSSAASPRDLAEGSGLMRRVHEAEMPAGVELTSIGAALDPVVPAASTGAPGVARLTVNPWSFNPHSAILTDPEALRAVRAAIEGRALPCVSFVDALVGSVAPELITRAEHAAGAAAGVASVLP